MEGICLFALSVDCVVILIQFLCRFPSIIGGCTWSVENFYFYFLTMFCPWIWGEKGVLFSIYLNESGGKVEQAIPICNVNFKCFSCCGADCVSRQVWRWRWWSRVKACRWSRVGSANDMIILPFICYGNNNTILEFTWAITCLSQWLCDIFFHGLWLTYLPIFLEELNN